MGKPIEVSRTEFSAAALREVAASTRDCAVVRRLLAIALILERHSRAEAARLNGMDRQTLRDWVDRDNQEGIAANARPACSKYAVDASDRGRLAPPDGCAASGSQCATTPLSALHPARIGWA